MKAGHSARAAAKHYNVSINFAIKLVRHWRDEGHIKPRFRGQPPGTGKLAPYHGFLKSTVKKVPDITLSELAEQLEQEHGVHVYPASIHKVLVSLGISYKKLWSQQNEGGQMSSANVQHGCSGRN